MDEQKKFMCFWGPGYTDPGEEIVELKPLDFFNENVGYDDDAVAEINALEPGQTYEGEHIISGSHYVTRVI